MFTPKLLVVGGANDSNPSEVIPVMASRLPFLSLEAVAVVAFVTTSGSSTSAWLLKKNRFRPTKEIFARLKGKLARMDSGSR